MAWDWNGIDIDVEIAFSTDPLASVPTYTNVSDYVRGIPQIFRGKTSEDSGISPAYAQIVFGNRDRRFDPDYGSSPYSPNVKPMRRVRITATKGAFSAVVFTGFVTSWRNDWSVDDGVSVVSCVDSTWWVANKPLAGSAYELEVLADDPLHYWPLQSGDTEVQDLGSADYPLTLKARALTEATLSGPEIQGYATVEQTNIARPIGAASGIAGGDLTTPALAAHPKALEFWTRLYPTDLANQTVRMTANATGTGVGADAQDFAISIIDGYFWLGYFDEANSVYTFLADTGVPVAPGVMHVVGYESGGTVYLRVNGKQVYSIALSAGGSAVNPGVTFTAYAPDGTDSGGISHIAIYTTVPSTSRFDTHYRVGLDAWGHPHGETSGTRIGRVLDEIGWPAGLRSIDTGITIQGPYLPAGQLALDYITQVVDSERGLFFVGRDGSFTFHDRVAMTNGSLDTGYVLSDDGAAGAVKYQELRMDPSTVDTIRNVVTVSYFDVGAITRRDATSEDDYGSSQLFIDGPTIPKARVASALASFELAQRKDPATRVASVRCVLRHTNSTQTTTQVEKLLDLELGDIIDVEITPLGVGSQVVKTVQVLGIEHEVTLDQWYVTLYLSPAYTQTGWFTLGTSSLGGTDILLP